MQLARYRNPRENYEPEIRIQNRMKAASELKVLITATAVAATLAGWAAFAKDTDLNATMGAPPTPSSIQVEGSAPALRSVTAPQAPPQPVTTTQSSR